MSGMGKASKKMQQRRGRSVKMLEKVPQRFAGQLEAFREKFGRDPEPGDPVFFDPDADTPTVMSEDYLRREMNRWAATAGIDPSWIYAWNKTGMFLSGQPGSMERRGPCRMGCGD